MDARRNAKKSQAQLRSPTRPQQQAAEPTIDPSREPNRTQCDRRYHVLLGLPDQLPVTDAELDLLERELAPFLAEMLKSSG